MMRLQRSCQAKVDRSWRFSDLSLRWRRVTCPWEDGFCGEVEVSAESGVVGVESMLNHNVVNCNLDAETRERDAKVQQ